MNKRDYKKKIEEALRETAGVEEKYKGAGCYSISIDDKLVYIGSSSDLFRRLVEHLYNIDFPQESTGKHKYEIIQQAYLEGHDINFDVIYRAIDKRDALTKEKELIRVSQPPLNTITYSGKRNEIARKGSLEEVLSA